MSRRGLRDVVVVGGGVVGAACALALAEQDLDVVLIEAAPPASWSATARDLRVYAFAPDNAALLSQLGVWPSVVRARAHPYRRMQVWDAAGGDALTFDADALARRELGWIVEHGLLVDRLWQALQASRVELRCPDKVVELERTPARDTSERGAPQPGGDRVQLRLADGGRLETRIAIAADGAASTLRTLAGIDVDAHAYGQRGVVAYVQTERPHADTAWQRFLPTGPLALLPCADGSCSIVWTLPDDEAARVLALDDEAFSREITHAFDARLGHIHPLSNRVAFPLRRQLAATQYEGRVLVIGDAAHAVHPLAGQGVNLGLRDVSALQTSVADARRRNIAWEGPQRLSRWARVRRSENTVAAYAFDGINRLFSNDRVGQTLLRGHLLGIAGRMPALVNGFWRRASGL
ncbi:FAD-dependent oxidoreductase [Luteimonas sp. RIT-PG2_3]